MIAELAPRTDATLYALVDELTCYQESLILLDAQLGLTLPDDERAEIQQNRHEALAAMDGIGRELANKTDAVAVVLRRLQVERDYIHDERDRLKAKEQACERAEKWLRDYVVSVMRQRGVLQLKTATNTLFVRNSEAVDIKDATLIPPVYMNAEIKLPLSLWKRAVRMLSVVAPEMAPEMETVRVHAEPSLSTIKRAIKSGTEVPGADIKLNENLICR